MGQLKGHLNYGGSITASHRLGVRASQGPTYKIQKRLETMIRLEAAGFPGAAIAAMLCISYNTFVEWKRTPDYLAARIKLTHGIILDHDSQLQNIREQRREILTAMLPAALQVVADELQKPATTLAERKHKTALAQDLMDREGLFAKVSKTEIKPVDVFDFERHDAESMSIINALKASSAPLLVQPSHATGGASMKPAAALLGHHTEEVIEANREFSNSHTLSAVDQQAALDSLEAESHKLDDILIALPPGTEKLQ